MFMRDPAGELPTLRHGRLVWTGLAVSDRASRSSSGLFPNLLLEIVGVAAAAI